MSSGEGGGGVFKSLESKTFSGKGNFFENLLSDVVNYGLQYSTSGLVGYGDGNLKTGVTTDVVVGGTKEVTGAAAAEEANRMAREQYEQTRKETAQARTAAQNQTALNQIQQSEMAQGARAYKGRTTASNAGQPVSGATLGGDERDYLGI